LSLLQADNLFSACAFIVDLGVTGGERDKSKRQLLLLFQALNKLKVHFIEMQPRGLDLLPFRLRIHSSQRRHVQGLQCKCIRCFFFISSCE